MKCSICHVQVDSHESLKIHWMNYLAPNDEMLVKDEEKRTNVKGKPPKFQDKQCSMCSYGTSRLIVVGVRSSSLDTCLASEGSPV
jgi:hypothetical protein